MKPITESMRKLVEAERRSRRFSKKRKKTRSKKSKSQCSYVRIAERLAKRKLAAKTAAAL